jgi:hypothetical protein
VPHDHPIPNALRQSLDSQLRAWLAESLQAAVAELDQVRAGVWIIRRLTLDAFVDVAALDSAELARLVSRQFVQQLQSVLSGTSNDGNVQFFPTRAAFVAHFIYDYLAGGSQAWGYSEFAGLRSLLRHQVVREAIVRAGGEQARAVLQTLQADGRLAQVLDAITDSDARHIWDTILIASTGDSPLTRHAVEQFNAHWPHARLEAPLASAKNRLRLLVEFDGDDTSLQALATHWLGFLDWVAASAVPLALLQRVVQGCVLSAELPPTLQPSIATIQQLAAGDADWLQQAVQEALPLTTPRATAAPTQAVATAAAGLFLLLPSLIDLKLHTLLRHHAANDATFQQWISWLLASCLGGIEWRYDPAFQLAFGWDAAHDDSVALPSLAEPFWQLLLTQRRALGVYLASSPTERGSVLHDMEADYWLALSDDQAAILAALAQMAQHAPLAYWPTQLQPPSGEPTTRFARNLKSAEAAVNHYWQPALDRASNQKLIPLAQAVMRTFARRLLGFSWSSPRYLVDNFLRGDGRLLLQDDQLIVQLPLVPLHSMLHLVGWQASEYRLPWHEDRTVRIVLP